MTHDHHRDERLHASATGRSPAREEGWQGGVFTKQTHFAKTNPIAWPRRRSPELACREPACREPACRELAERADLSGEALAKTEGRAGMVLAFGTDGSSEALIRLAAQSGIIVLSLSKGLAAAALHGTALSPSCLARGRHGHSKASSSVGGPLAAAAFDTPDRHR